MRRRRTKKIAKKVRRTKEERARARLATQECRERERRKLALYYAVIDAQTLDRLVRDGYISDAATLDKKAVSKGLSAALWDWGHSLSRPKFP